MTEHKGLFWIYFLGQIYIPKVQIDNAVTYFQYFVSVF